MTDEQDSDMWTRRMAEFIVDCDTQGAPPVVRELALQPIVDTIGCMLSGLPSPAGVRVLEYAGFDVSATLADLWGDPGTALDPERRALVGGTLGHALDFDDVSGYGHPSAILLSTILSADDGPTIDGGTLLDAYLVGYEVSVKTGQMMHLPHYRHGWHTTSTAGCIAAVAAAARLYGLDVEQTLHALGIAASMVSGIRRNFGTMTKPLHSGHAARSGLAAARLAANGVTAATDVLEGPRGFVEMYSMGKGNPEPAGDLGGPWAMEARVPSLKKFPSCFSTHRVIDAMLDIQREHDFLPDEVERIIVRAPTISLTPLVYHRPVNGLQAKFSAHYVVAAAFLDKAVRISSFEPDAVRRTEIDALYGLMDVAEDPRCRPEDPDGANSSSGSGGFWEVTVEATDGRRGQASCAHAPGAPERPLLWSEIEDKFVDCAMTAGHDAALSGDVLAELRSLPDVSDVRRVLAHLGRRSV